MVEARLVRVQNPAYTPRCPLLRSRPFFGRLLRFPACPPPGPSRLWAVPPLVRPAPGPFPRPSPVFPAFGLPVSAVRGSLILGVPSFPGASVPCGPGADRGREETGLFLSGVQDAVRRAECAVTLRSGARGRKSRKDEGRPLRKGRPSSEVMSRRYLTVTISGLATASAWASTMAFQASMSATPAPLQAVPDQ